MTAETTPQLDNSQLAQLVDDTLPATPERLRSLLDVLGKVKQAPGNVIAGIRGVRTYADDVPVSWIQPGMLREGTVCMLVGDPSAGKSSFAAAWLYQVAIGGTFFGHDHEPRPVLYLCKDSDSLGDVIARFDWLRIGDGGTFKFFGANLCEHDVPDPWDDEILGWLNRDDMRSKRPIFVIDSFVHFLRENDDNSNKDINHFWKNIERLKKVGCSFVIIHHAGKAETAKKYRGGSAIRAGCDYMFTMEGHDKNGLLERIDMKRFKSRSGVPFGNKDSKLTVLVGDDGSFTIGEVAKPKSKRDEESEETATVGESDKLTAIVKANPGITGDRLEKLAKEQHGIGQKASRRWRLSGISDGSVVKRVGPRGATFHYLAAMAPAETADCAEGILMPSEAG